MNQWMMKEEKENEIIDVRLNDYIGWIERSMIAVGAFLDQFRSSDDEDEEDEEVDSDSDGEWSKTRMRAPRQVRFAPWTHDKLTSEISFETVEDCHALQFFLVEQREGEDDEDEDEELLEGEEGGEDDDGGTVDGGRDTVEYWLLQITMNWPRPRVIRHSPQVRVFLLPSKRIHYHSRTT